MSGFVIKLLSGVITATSIAIIPVSVMAQATDRYKQGIDRAPARQVTLQPKNDLASSTDETQILASVKGIVIINSPDELNSRAVATGGVESLGEVVPQDVSSAAQIYVGQPLSLASLSRLTRDMVLAYRKAGIPVVNVVVPPQDITNGVIQIVAVVGRLGELAVQGDTPNPGYYTEGFPLVRGDVIEENAVLDQLRWKSRRFHRRVNAVYAPGSSFGETDIFFDVDESKPWTIFAGADNTGSGGIGDYRLFGGFTVGDLWNLDHELSYQFTTSENGPDALGAHVASYIMPVGMRTDLQFTAAFVNSFVDTGPGTTEGESLQLGATFITQLPRTHGWSNDARYGFEYKKSNNIFEFGGVVAGGNETQIGQFFLELTGQRGDAKSHTSFSAGVWWSPGDLFDNNTNAAFAATRSNASASYVYGRAGIDHTIFLPNDWFVNIDANAQIASERLLPSEEMFLGGINTVRGFDENSLRGDNGIVARFEIHTPSVSLLKDGPKDSLRLYGFLDAGAVSINGIPNATEGDASIVGAGVGLTYQIANNFTAELAYGWRLDSDALVPVTGHDEHGQFHFRVLTRF